MKLSSVYELMFGSFVRKREFLPIAELRRALLSTGLLLFCGIATLGQTSVTTQHNDIGRTGANPNETILTPANVNTNSFGKLFSAPVDGYVYEQPLYMPGVTMGAGTAQPNTTHNVIFVATENDTVYAFDADNNTGADANPLWKASLVDAKHGAGSGETSVPSSKLNTGDIVPVVGITSTPVIDPTTNTIYVVAKSTVTGTTFIQRLHALDIATGLEKFGGPVQLSGSVAGNGNGSSGGVLNWDPKWENNRASLLLLNGIIYIGFGSHNDQGPWHGWILAYNANTLAPTGAWCATPNGLAGGIWMGGTGLAADVPAGKPYGRIFTVTGNGTFDAVAPNYTNAMDYGDSIIKLDLANGVPTMISGTTTVGDDFTPLNQASLNNGDQDQASGGLVILPAGTGGGGNQLVQVGKSQIVYVLNRENLGGYHPTNSNDPGNSAQLAGGVWGAPAYWNGNVYVWGENDHLKMFKVANGSFTSRTATSTSAETANTYTPTPSISANGTTSGIVWTMRTDNFDTQGRAVLYAHDATNVANLLYSSESNVSRDNPGNSVKFVVPTVVNGKVYVGAESQLSVYGLLSGLTQAATPVINPVSESFSSSVQATITDSTTGATIYDTTDGSTPTTASSVYTAPFTVTTTTTVNAIAAGTGLLASPMASQTYTLISQVSMPSFNPAPGIYSSAQPVAISTSTPNATIYFTTDGKTPTTSSAKYAAPINVAASETLSAIAVASGLSNSPVASGLYTIQPGGVTTINYASGFTATGMNFLGSAKLNGTALRLTDGGQHEVAAAWYGVEASIQTFTTDFTFVISGSTNTADGFTFTLQGNNGSAIGIGGSNLGYGASGGAGGIANSVAVKFDLYNNSGEGVDSTGLYTNGAWPTIPAVDMTSSGVNLHSGDPFHVHISYDGTNLTMTITDVTTNATFAHAWPVDIPTIVGDVVAFVGFTGGTGGLAAIQDIQTWTFTTATGTGPAITSLSPTSGAVGASVTITGTNFGSTQGTSTVTFNGTTATTISSWSATSIVAKVPTGATTGNVVVTVGGVASNGSSFTVLATPTITSLSPTSGAVGASVTITGTNFGSTQGTSTVTFNGTTATTISSWSATSIVAKVPTGATTGNVVVTVGGVASNGSSFTVLATPTITSLSPTSGAVGASMTITGTNFGSTQGTSTVTFNGTTATTISSWSATSIVVPVPAGATTGNVVVTVGGVASNGSNFTVLATPTISSLSPTSGAVGASVTITGTNFGSTQGTSTVTFNGTTATTISSWSATSIVAKVPTGAATGNVVVTVGGVASNGSSFTVLATPTITSLSPTSGAVGASVTITGTNFGSTQGTSTVTFNGTTATTIRAGVRRASWRRCRQERRRGTW